MNDESKLAARVGELSPQQAVYATSELARRRKAPAVAWLLWFFLGGIGAHDFYLGRTGSGIGKIALVVAASATVIFGVGFFLFAIDGVWVIVDAFLMGSAIRSANACAEREVLGSLHR